MKYAISYNIPDDDTNRKHVRYYSALNEETAKSMFEATCEESLAGENPHIVDIKNLSEEDNTWHFLQFVVYYNAWLMH